MLIEEIIQFEMRGSGPLVVKTDYFHNFRYFSELKDLSLDGLAM